MEELYPPIMTLFLLFSFFIYLIISILDFIWVKRNTSFGFILYRFLKNVHIVKTTKKNDNKGNIISITFNLLGRKEINYFHDNGQLKNIENYNHHKKDGEWKSYYKTGELLRIENYKKDKKEGEFITYYENGEICKFEKYEFDRNIDETKVYDKIGNLIRLVNYNEENIYVTVKSYYENRNIKSIGNFDYGNENNIGELKEYYENGKLKGIGNCNDSFQKIGIWKEFYENGIIKSIDNYQKGILNGESKIYDENGNLVKTQKYYKGEII